MFQDNNKMDYWSILLILFCPNIINTVAYLECIIKNMYDLNKYELIKTIYLIIFSEVVTIFTVLEIMYLYNHI